MLDPETTKRELEPVLDWCSAALVYGVQQAARFFSALPLDRELFCHIVRYWVRLIVRDGDLLKLDELPNTGMELAYGRYRIRVWNGPDGELPGPGASLRLRDFYRQPYLLEPDASEPVRLAILWEANMKQGELVGIWLVCPRSAENLQDVHWRISLPVPVLPAAAVTNEPVDDDLPLALRDDDSAALKG